MDDLRERIRRELLPIRPSPDGLERTLGRVYRRRRNRRTGAATVALLLTAALVAGLLQLVRQGPRPAVVPTGERIAFARGGPDGGIYAMRPDGSGLVRLTSEPGDASPAWSPDGTRIAFVRFTDGNEDVFVMRADGSDVRRLTDDGSSSSPSWSPDGTRIVFARETPPSSPAATGNADVYVMRADGSHVLRLTDDALLEYTPTWSPDGSEIAFVGFRQDPPPASPLRLYVMQADGTDPRTIGPDDVAYPSWSPDGSRIAFLGPDGGAIGVISRDGTGLRRVVDLRELDGGAQENATTGPAWSPDGSRLAFAAGPSVTATRVFVVGADGSDPVQLTRGSNDVDPAWSPAVTSAPPPTAIATVDAVVADRSGAWALTCDSGCAGDRRDSVGSVLRLDPSTGSVLGSVSIRNPSGIAVGEGGVWVISFWDGVVYRVGESSDRVEATVPLELPFPVCDSCPDARSFLPSDVAVGEGAVWVSTARGAVARIDPATNSVTDTIRLPGDATGDLAVGEGSVWVAEDVLGVGRIDAATDSVVARIAVGDGVRRLAVGQIAVGDGAVFVEGAWARRAEDPFGHVEYVAAPGAAVARIDPATGRSEVLAGEGRASTVAFDSGSLWVWRSGGTALARLDPATGRETATVTAPAGGVFVGASGGRGWVAFPDGHVAGLRLPG